MLVLPRDHMLELISDGLNKFMSQEVTAPYQATNVELLSDTGRLFFKRKDADAGK